MSDTPRCYFPGCENTKFESVALWQLHIESRHQTLDTSWRTPLISIATPAIHQGRVDHDLGSIANELVPVNTPRYISRARAKELGVNIYHDNLSTPVPVEQDLRRSARQAQMASLKRKRNPDPHPDKWPVEKARALFVDENGFNGRKIDLKMIEETKWSSSGLKRLRTNARLNRPHKNGKAVSLILLYDDVYLF